MKCFGTQVKCGPAAKFTYNLTVNQPYCDVFMLARSELSWPCLQHVLCMHIYVLWMKDTTIGYSRGVSKVSPSAYNLQNDKQS